MKTLLTCLLIAVLGGAAKAQQTPAGAIREAMDEQSRSWNQGDLTGFMAYYWKSDSLRFIGSRGVTYGWKQTLMNYQKSYPTAAAMGQLTFDIKSIEPLSDDTQFVIGKWTLKLPEKEIGGYYTLLWKKIRGQWLIVVDHTS